MTRIMQPNQLFLFLLAAILFQFCSQEEFIAPGTQTVQFTFGLKGIPSADLPAGSSVVLSINKASGEAALTHHAVRIQSHENGFITEPIPLASNEYFVTEFMVVHDNVALYATPKTGSKFSGLVDMPLAYSVDLREDDAVLPLQVVSTRDAAAREFGYATLRVRQANQWKIMVFTREDRALEESAAWAYLTAPGISYNMQLHPGMNTLSFQGDPNRTYMLVVEKAGYETYKIPFVYNAIRGKGNKPFKVVLDRVQNDDAFIITPPKAEGEFTFGLGLRGNGSLTIDWGDGTIETVSFTPDPGSDNSIATPQHVYAGPLPPDGNQISIKGDLDQIFLYESISVYASYVDPRNLKNLQSLQLFGVFINGLLDLSSNSKLQTLSFEATYAWEIRLPESHEISEVFLTAELSQPVVDMLIENIYENAVEKNITSGRMTVVPPLELSPVSAQMVQDLVDNYGWELTE